MFSNENSAKFCNKYFCDICNYNTERKSSFKDHLLSRRHIKSMNGNENSANSAIHAYNICCPNCNKTYKDYSGLWRHKKKCIAGLESESISNNVQTDKDLIISLLKQNTELLEIVKNGTHNITNTNNSHNTNSHNKSFNLQFFLNETCKNAMNITDFVNSLQLQLSDLEKVGEIGYVEGISNIIIKNLNALDVTLRPVHCTDKKRETMYVKDENKWEKEDDNKSKLHKMIRKVSNKNIDLITDFKELNPDWKKSTSKVSSQFDKIIIESMGGTGENDYEKEERIIKRVSKSVFVDKSL
jgi:hypothetical protein